MLRFILCASSLILFFTLNAQSEARIDIMSSGTIPVGLVYNGGSETLNGTQAAWLNENKDKRLVVSTTVTTVWKRYSFTFTAKNTGIVSLILMGASQSEVCFANITAEGTVLLNGTFDMINDKELPVSWSTSGNPQLVNLKDGAYVRVHHDKRFYQNIKVEEGRPVKITFNSRSLATAQNAALVQ